MRATMVVLLAVVLAASCAQGAQQFKVKGKVDSVTLYRGQALVTRAVPFNAPAGAVQLTVTDLPESVLSQSLFASAGKGVQVRAVRFRTFATGKAPQAEVRKLDDQIAELEKKTRENESQQTLLRQLQSYLGNLQSFVAPSVKVELSKGVLNADTLAKITDMVFQKHGDLSKQALALAETSRQLKEQLALLQRKRHELTRSHSKTTREAVVFLEKMNGGKGDIQLHYLVSNATWEPTYNLRAKGDMRNVDVEYSALAQQMSGEDWDDVKLTLSTAAAQMVADGPSIAPLFVRLSRTPSRYGGLAEMERRYRTSQTQLRYQQEALQKSAGRDRQIDANWEMNVAANEAQSLELIAPTADMYLMRKVMGEASGGLSVNYKLEGKVSLASRRERQMVEIKKLTLPATFYNEAAPLLGEYVYRYAQLTNNSALSLLEGRSNVYLDGDFVGSGTVAMVARGQKLTVGFGIEPQLRAWREFVSKKEHVQGGNRNVVFQYRLVLDNYSDKAIVVRAVDRIPVPKADIRVTLGELKDKLSTDAEYLRAHRPRGILRWDISVPAKSAATTARIVEYSFTLEFDKNMHISGDQASTVQKKLKQDFYRSLREGKR